jgi:N-acyl-D-amino-acid deacylase
VLDPVHNVTHIATVVLAVCALAATACARDRPDSDIPMTGIEVPGLRGYDRAFAELLGKYEIPGGAFALAKDGRLVLARGYGWADEEEGQPVQPDSLFRIASLSKPITAAAILRLVEEGQLDLDEQAFHILGSLRPAEGAAADPRIYEITIRQLLSHTGGWDREQSFDPMFIPLQAAQAVGAPAPATCETVIRYMLGQPLDDAPGTRFAYSNFGYCVLGRIIEEVTGRPYESYVQAEVLRPAGIARMRIGRSLLEGRAEGEARYYDYPRGRQVRSVFSTGPQYVPEPYGGFHLEAMAAHGGWIASAIDLVRFALAVDRRSPPPDVLQPATIALMVAPPPLAEQERASSYYALGWEVEQGRNGTYWFHAGGLPGTRTWLFRTDDGFVGAVLLNGSANAGGLQPDLFTALERTTYGINRWPTHDLFERYP